ncbi:baeRF11 domain-containing protein [Oceanisphaera sp. W20_SRM_FM3]|uniref:baeRF11 domain-containing protein n=1 Tax=Oceanisphaera sp. W20_SRM_FM3 TaxID=3240267 RepID=UPI003F9DC592
MYYLDLPSVEEVGNLNLVRSDASISIYLATTPISRETDQTRVTLANLIKKAIKKLEAQGVEKSRILLLQQRFDDLLADKEFWDYQANSLAILATPESLRTYRLANRLQNTVEVSDRFHLKPLLRAVTFSHSAYILALSENAVRLIQVSPDLPAKEITVPNLPDDAADATNKVILKDSSGKDQRPAAHAYNAYLANYVRKINAALRPLHLHAQSPIILAATQPLDGIFRSLTRLNLLPTSIVGNPDRLSAADLAIAARPVLDAHYQSIIDDFHQLFIQRTGQKRTTTDISDAARLATFGGIERLLVDIEGVVTGVVDEETGAVSFVGESDAICYGIVDEISCRALRTGAKVMAVRKADIPGGHDLAALTRYPI